MHPRNFGLDKIIGTYVRMYIHPFHVKGFEMSHILAWSPKSYNILDIHAMLQSINSFQGYPLTSVTWLYHRLRCTTHCGVA